MASAKKSIKAAVLADVTIALVKFLGGALTGSSVMLAEGAHSLVDGGNASLLLYGQRRGARPPDERHPFGHAGEVYFWSILVAMLAFVLGGGFAVLEGILSFHHQEHGRLWPNFLILGIAFVFDGGSLLIARRELKRYQRERGYRGGLFSLVRQSHNPPIFLTVLVDTAAIIGLIIAGAGIALGALLHEPVIDAVASILIGVLLMAMASLFAIEIHGLIVGEGARGTLIDHAREIVTATDGLASLEEMRTLQLGPDAILVAIKARWQPWLSIGEVADRCRSLEERLRDAHPSIRHVVFDF